MAKKSQPKKVTVKLLERQRNGKPSEPYQVMDKLIAEHHPHLAQAEIAICWRYGWSEDVDGRLRLGQASKASDCERALQEYDLVLLLNWEAWNTGGLDGVQQRALLDHELTHCQVALDEDGEPKVDEDGRIVYRIRKHDVEEFREVVERHGLYTDDLQEFAQAGIKDSERPLLADEEK